MSPAEIAQATPHFESWHLGPLGHLPTDDELCLKVLHNHGV